jgi:hypothetical protein
MKFKKLIEEISKVEDINEAIKKKKVSVGSYGSEDVDITELHVWLSSDDNFSVSHDVEDSNDNSVNWGGDFYSWMDSDLEITVTISGKKTVLMTSYDEDKDLESISTKSGLKGETSKLNKYGRDRNVYVIPVEANTKDISVSVKALIES